MDLKDVLVDRVNCPMSRSAWLACLRVRDVNGMSSRAMWLLGRQEEEKSEWILVAMARRNRIIFAPNAAGNRRPGQSTEKPNGDA